MTTSTPNTTVPTTPRLTVLVAAGGTAGHLAPALAVADELRDAGHRVVVAASSGRADAGIVQAAGYEVELFSIGGLPRTPGMAQLRAIGRAVGAVGAAARIVRRVQPDVVLAAGGFVAAPVALAARSLGVPVVATEADAHLGLANRISGRVARRLCTAYPLAQLRGKQEVTGRPVARAFGQVDRATAREQLGLPGDARVVAVVGGSGGATRMNEATIGTWGSDPDPRVGGEPLWVVHVAGRRDHPHMVARGVASDRYRLLEYCDDMPALLAAADLMVTRPGGSLFELAAVGRAAVLVPSPNVTADHQTLNARWFVARGGGVLVTDAELDPARLRAEVEELLAPAGDARRAELATAMAALARPDAAARIATVVAQCGAMHRREDGDDDVSTVPGADLHTDDTVPAGEDALLAGRRFHMLGVGGAGVSALAQLCAAWGAEVSGCDPAGSTYAEHVRAAGIDVLHGHSPSHVAAGTTVVASSAVPTDHPELARARELGCPVVLRGELLGELTRLRDTVVVAGAHGKSTTTGMLAHASIELGLDPAVAVGATLPGLEGGNVRAGAGPFLVEGDESDRTLLALTARIAVVTNIERDHHHTFASDEEVEELFATWVGSLGADSLLVAGPGPVLDRLVVHAPGRVVRFGADEREVARTGERLAVPGRHNALNALAACAVLEELGVDRARALDALAGFRGVGRRFEQHGEAAGVLVVDDYAHHPTEVAATVQAARELARARAGRVLVAFQPHLYSRTQALWREFADALAAADRAWVLPVYGAREEPVAGVDERLIADALDDRAADVYAGPGTDDPATGDVATIVGETRPGDVLITMGAGSITTLAPRLLDALASGSGAAAPAHVADPEWLERDAPLHRFTTIGTGGAARLLAKVRTETELRDALAMAAELELPIAVIGLGSNTLVADEGFSGLALRLTGELSAIDVDAEAQRVVLGGGASLAAAVRLCREAGLSGFEFACAIPGTAGGALKMNAGAYGGEMRDVVTRAHLVGPGGVREVTPADLDMRYRHTNIAATTVVSRVELALGRDEPEVIKARVKEMQGRRTDTQPRAARSFGSVFQNPSQVEGVAPEAIGPEGRPLGAGALIEAVGLRGHRIGGARISPKHGNFIENDEGGTTNDVLALIHLARTTVHERFGVRLETEVHLLARDGYRQLQASDAAPPAPEHAPVGG